jgi:hypothetical protein
MHHADEARVSKDPMPRPCCRWARQASTGMQRKGAAYLLQALGCGGHTALQIRKGNAQHQRAQHGAPLRPRVQRPNSPVLIWAQAGAKCDTQLHR